MIIETPAMVLDIAKVQKNINHMQEMADMLGLKLRPHIKTHKMPELAKMQIKRGASGITCASLSEAECFAAHGIDDIFIAYEIIGKSKLERLFALMERARVITGVDSKEGVAALSDAAYKRGVTAEVRVEVDTGMHRAGVPYEQASDFAAYVSGLPNIKLTGIFTYKSSVFQQAATLNSPAAAREESAMMAELADKLRKSGVNIQDISGGSTPTAEFSGETAGLTEIRPGSYIFGDAMRLKTGAITPSDCAAYVSVTVISAPEPNRAVIDGGSKVFSGDFPINAPPYYLQGHGYIIGHEHLTFTRMSEEHGVIESRDGSPTGLKIGQILNIVPNHTCTSMNLFTNAYIINMDRSVRKERIEARGCSY